MPSGRGSGWEPATLCGVNSRELRLYGSPRDPPSVERGRPSFEFKRCHFAAVAKTRLTLPTSSPPRCSRSEGWCRQVGRADGVHQERRSPVVAESGSRERRNLGALLGAARMRRVCEVSLQETPGNVGRALVDIEAEGVEGLYLVGERTSAAKIMGVYGSAQVALGACDLILQKYPVTP